MPISQQDYFKLPTESIDQYNTRIASLRASQPATPQPNQLPSDLPSLQKIVDQASQTVQGLASQVQARVQPITNPVPANTIKPVTTPSLPEPKAPSVISNFVGGIQQNLETTRKAFEDSVKAERDNLDKQRKQYETQIADFNTKEQNTIQNDVQPLLQPFRADLEKNERERLKVEENYFENQKIVNEIQTLANGLQQDIATVQDVAAPAAIQEGKIGKIKEDSLARIGVLQAVVSMRNGQISTALNFIDRSSEAIVADRQDRLNYFNTLLNFYEGQKDDTGKKLLDVEAKDLRYVKTQIGLLENDLNTAQKSFDNIREMMLDPSKADILARSGVKLTDTPEQVAQKISNYTYSQEKQDLQNQMALKGYSLLAFPAQYAGKDPKTLLHIKDSKGNDLVFYNPQGSSIFDSPTGSGNPAQRNNNPGNIKVTDYSLKLFKDLGGNASSTQATDSGTFLQFPTVESGFQAMKMLLKSPVYVDMKVGAALEKWSTKGYGADVAIQGGIDPNAKVKDLSDAQLDSLTQAMAKREGFYDNVPTQTNPQLQAYAQQYASTGTIPSGLPEGAFGAVAAAAKALPKADGTLIDKTTGVTPASSKISDTSKNGISALYDLTKKIDEAKILFSKFNTGFLAGTLGSVFPGQDRSAYNNLRSEVVDLLARARTGAALTAQEEQFYLSKLPGNFNQSFFVGQDGTTLLDSLRKSIDDKLNTTLNLSGLEIVGKDAQDAPLNTSSVTQGTTSSGLKYTIE